MWGGVIVGNPSARSRDGEGSECCQSRCSAPAPTRSVSGPVATAQDWPEQDPGGAVVVGHPVKPGCLVLDRVGITHAEHHEIRNRRCIFDQQAGGPWRPGVELLRYYWWSVALR